MRVIITSFLSRPKVCKLNGLFTKSQQWNDFLVLPLLQECDHRQNHGPLPSGLVHRSTRPRPALPPSSLAVPCLPSSASGLAEGGATWGHTQAWTTHIHHFLPSHEFSWVTGHQCSSPTSGLTFPAKPTPFAPVYPLPPSLHWKVSSVYPHLWISGRTAGIQ